MSERPARGVKRPVDYAKDGDDAGDELEEYGADKLRKARKDAAALEAAEGEPDDALAPTRKKSRKKSRKAQPAGKKRNWSTCDNCDSGRGMFYGFLGKDKKPELVACSKCAPDQATDLGVKIKDMSRVCDCGSGSDKRYGEVGGEAVACVACKDLKASEGGAELVNLRPSSGDKCDCDSGKVKRFGWPPGHPQCPTAADGGRVTARVKCNDCKLPGMVNLSLSKQADTKASWGGKCNCGSGKSRKFGVRGGARTNCHSCKTEGMVNLSKKVCACGSGKEPRFGPAGGKASKCSACKTGDMVDLSKKKRPTSRAPAPAPAPAPPAPKA